MFSGYKNGHTETYIVYLYGPLFIYIRLKILFQCQRYSLVEVKYFGAEYVVILCL